MSTTRLVCLGAAVCAATALAQTVSAQPNKTPVAYVYVANTPAGSSVNDVQAFAADPNGKLVPVPGSPFPYAVTSMAVNGLYLMGASQTGPDVNAYHIEPNGALSLATTTDYAAPNTNGCGGSGHVYFDHSGQDLYVTQYNIDCANTGISSWAVNKWTGGLSYLGNTITGAFPGNWNETYFTGNNLYAYAADNDSCMYYNIYGFQRAANGLLSTIPASYNLPTPPSTFTRYIPSLSAADPTNHVAFVMYPGYPPGCINAPLQLASYTADGSGNLSTANTAANMPTTQIASPYDMKMAPSGKLLALAGQEGLQVFHFNGAAPITHFTGLLTADPITQMFWDNANHLYAISTTANKLHVFTITATAAHEAPGSPYSIASPGSIIVQPLPLPWN
ncbi:hypothetical protein DYQ86_00515 [Acidobacteria bacterium AB60]|nr:hypothetical protein DYQ86_00515 [Acidobacteria bacterium AB60]